jgi:hypothetical protein
MRVRAAILGEKVWAGIAMTGIPLARAVVGVGTRPVDARG